MDFYPVTGITQKGEGVIRLDGKVCFVPGALPGEEIAIKNLLQKKKYARANLAAIQNPAPFRREPACAQSQNCGGCVWQHVTYEQQLVFKREMIEQQLRRIGGLACEVRPVLGMDKPEEYRNKVILHCAEEKKSGTLTLGFYNAASHETAPIGDCILLTPAMQQVVRLLKEQAGPLGLKPGNDVMLRQSSVDGALLLVVSAEKKTPPEEKNLLALPRMFPIITSLCIFDEGELRPIYGEPWQMQQLAGCRFKISARSFFQTNIRQTEVLYAEVRKMIPRHTPKNILDAFCGAGTISCMLAKDGHTVTGIESNPFSVENARENARLNGVTAGFICAPCEKEIARLPKKFDIIVVDPPRAGCFPPALEAIITLRPEKIVYVSCEPATLARDLRVLTAAGYKVEYVQPVDMFPWTGHVETVCLLTHN